MKKLHYPGAWALITGASSGLGAEFARQLAHRGSNLVISARNQQRLQQFGDDLRRVNGVEVRAVAADLSTSDGITGLLNAVDDLKVPIRHLINNAGFGSVGAFADGDAEQERRMLHVNVEAVVALSRHFLPRLLAVAEGGIIQVASTVAHQPTPFMATYGASKAFVLNFALALSEEVRGSGVRVLTLCPGPVPTGFQAAAGFETTGLMRLTKLEASEVVERALAAYEDGKRIVTPGVLNAAQTRAVKVLPEPVVLRAARWAMQSLGRTTRRNSE
ncbi:MAG TPA: SDR family oxidoreductase [Polyangiaceae bacterium]|nr:SDR family oxidoreductase [Polyangiaceae bacterium]